MPSKKQSVYMNYEVHAGGHCHENLCASLRSALRQAKELWRKGLPDVAVYRFDRGGPSHKGVLVWKNGALVNLSFDITRDR